MEKKRKVERYWKDRWSEGSYKIPKKEKNKKPGTPGWLRL